MKTPTWLPSGPIDRWYRSSVTRMKSLIAQSMDSHSCTTPPLSHTVPSCVKCSRRKFGHRHIVLPRASRTNELRIKSRHLRLHCGSLFPQQVHYTTPREVNRVTPLTVAKHASFWRHLFVDHGLRIISKSIWTAHQSPAPATPLWVFVPTASALYNTLLS